MGADQQKEQPRLSDICQPRSNRNLFYHQSQCRGFDERAFERDSEKPFSLTHPKGRGLDSAHVHCRRTDNREKSGRRNRDAMCNNNGRWREIDQERAVPFVTFGKCPGNGRRRRAAAQKPPKSFCVSPPTLPRSEVGVGGASFWAGRLAKKPTVLSRSGRETGLMTM